MTEKAVCTARQFVPYANQVVLPLYRSVTECRKREEL